MCSACAENVGNIKSWAYEYRQWANKEDQLPRTWVWGALFPGMIKRDNWLKKYIDLKMGLI